MKDPTPEQLTEMKSDSSAAAILTPMGITSENVSKVYKIGRSAQDKFAFDSHKKSTEAWRKGHFDYEVVYPTNSTTTKSKPNFPDNGIRDNISLEALSTLKPSFKKNGTTTAGNSSQVSH